MCIIETSASLQVLSHGRLIDNPYGGRLRIQIFGFLGVGTCYIVSAAAFHRLTTTGGKGTFQVLYFFSSFPV